MELMMNIVIICKILEIFFLENYKKKLIPKYLSFLPNQALQK